MASDSTILSKARKKAGVTDETKFPDALIEDEIERGKTEINREIKQRLDNGGSIDLYETDAAVDALEHFVSLRMMAHKSGKKGPKSVSEMRRKDLPDPAMQEQANKVTYYLRKLYDGN